MDGTYAPQSPDLSGFLPSPSKKQQQYAPTSQNTSYAPRSPVIPSYNQTAHHLNSYQPQIADPGYSLGGNDFSEYGAQYMPPIPALPATHSFHNAPAQQSPYFHQQQQQQQPLKSEPSYNSYTSDDADGEYLPQATMGSRAPRIKGEDSSFQPQNAAPQYKDPNPNNIEIKTKFPVARIKRIMQADEEVGKVAQVTPVAVNKALELFMIALVGGAAEKAREKGGKRVTAQHLKMVVEGDEQFDFLGEIVGRVAEVQEGAGGEGRKRKEKVASESEEEDKKPKKGKGRRKKSDD